MCNLFGTFHSTLRLVPCPSVSKHVKYILGAFECVHDRLRLVRSRKATSLCSTVGVLASDMHANRRPRIDIREQWMQIDAKLGYKTL